ncbi:DUF5710 domain-containing protein [Burkholderia cenocepacia]|uniref:DUF5710 domain-containing protein n=1 Tax=Burkholderia cenocepacia TaxID=95486 RepID=UPI00222F00CF|nr:DUF5710 domain-containing protein [Burkholderia cenocepacia]MCW3609089.1 DUF5710 domain-containing protein [Burkholderia cenocepacia]MCW5189923.1 DUF5710 domain-containing protein [Burkholderia cenocepacia]
MADEKKPKRERTYLDVPFKEKDTANELGAKFDRRSKKWYVPGGTDVAPFARWMPAQDRQVTAPKDEQTYGSAADVEREAQRISELMSQPIEEARDVVRQLVRRAEEKAAQDARDHVRDQGGSAFDMVDAVRAAVSQARHQYFAERQHLYAAAAQQQPSVGARAPRRDARRGTRQAPVRRAEPKLDDAILGRRYREMIQSIATTVTLRGDEVNRTLALEHRLESIHRDAWRKSNDAAAGDRAIGEQIRTRTGFAADELPPLAAEALSKLRAEAELSPIEVDERTPVRDVTESDPVDDEQQVEPIMGEPSHAHRHREPERDDGIATFADIAEAFELDEAMRERAPEAGPATGELGPVSQSDGETVTFADVGEAATVDTAPGDRTPSPAEPVVVQPAPTVAPEDRTVTFSGVTDATPIDDAMRSRGLTADVVSVTQDTSRSTVGATVANEPDVQPGQAVNDKSMNVSVQPGQVDTQIKRTLSDARNEPDAKNPVNDPVRPELDTVSPQDLQRIGAVRASERAAAETLLREQSRPMPKAEDVATGAPAVTVDVDAGENQIDIDPSLRKPITTRDGYAIPPQIASRYMVKEGRFWKLDGMGAKPGSEPTTKPHFEDVGSRLKTQQNDRGTIADMLAVMKAKNIDSITVKGSETFRRNAWIEASLDGGIEVKNFKPKEADFALLEAAKRERAALTIKSGTSPEPTVSPKADVTPKVEAAPATPATPARAAATDTPKVAQAQEATAKPTDSLSGELLEHGSARYQHQKDASYSYFVRYRDDAGTEQTVWGVDLKRAMEVSGAKVGDAISLKNLGETPVTVQAPVRDEAGNVIGTEPKDAIRNAWEVTRTTPEPAPAESKAPARESLTVAQMREQLSKVVEKMPARQRAEVLNRFDARMQAGTEVEDRIARGELSRDAGAAEIDKRAAELHAAWTAPKAAPTSNPSNGPKQEQQPARGQTPSVM